MYGFLIQVASVAAPHAAQFLAENAIFAVPDPSNDDL
jgi:hypothetical protein